MGDLGGTVEGNAPSAGAGFSNGDNANEGSGSGSVSSNQAGVALEVVAAVGAVAVAAIAAVTAGSPLAAASAVIGTLGAIGFVMDQGPGVVMGDLNAVASASAVQVGTAAILAANGVTLNATQTESIGMYDAMGGTEQVAIADIVAGAKVFDPIGAEYNPTLNAFLVSIPAVDQILQGTQPGSAILLTNTGAFGLTGAATAEVETAYGSADGGKLNIWLPDNDLVTFTPDLQTMSIMRVSDWVNAYYGELQPDGYPSTVGQMLYDREVRNPSIGAPEPAGGNG
jgi:hypothetical protein